MESLPAQDGISRLRRIARNEPRSLRRDSCGRPIRLDPNIERLAGRRRNFELNWPLRLLLHDYRPGSYAIAVTDVADTKSEKVASAQLAVDAEIKQRKFPRSPLHLQPNFQRAIRREPRQWLQTDLTLPRSGPGDWRNGPRDHM